MENKKHSYKEFTHSKGSKSGYIFFSALLVILVFGLIINTFKPGAEKIDIGVLIISLVIGSSLLSVIKNRTRKIGFSNQCIFLNSQSIQSQSIKAFRYKDSEDKVILYLNDNLEKTVSLDKFSKSAKEEILLELEKRIIKIEDKTNEEFKNLDFYKPISNFLKFLVVMSSLILLFHLVNRILPEEKSITISGTLVEPPKIIWDDDGFHEEFEGFIIRLNEYKGTFISNRDDYQAEFWAKTVKANEEVSLVISEKDFKRKVQQSEEPPKIVVFYSNNIPIHELTYDGEYLIKKTTYAFPKPELTLLLISLSFLLLINQFTGRWKQQILTKISEGKTA